ncbi:hypothetical protein L249_6428 [Ophiocordyceps polyrhachis-furcata BCC 54312]|uniref:Uncharacterized protein n=1 Tax=Ophiocordyceps polyrhachis-furcata BCC 54312 TaxID=1330021 RepID=A0A367LL40_9HYPO|nr:hypothetical protein L249_6428 [Ophiocordyceps polyrhachis-furcata BCC 54312]
MAPGLKKRRRRREEDVGAQDDSEARAGMATQHAPPQRSPDPQQPAADDREEEDEAPGPRASRLRETYGLAVQRTLSKLSRENLARCYPSTASHAASMLADVQRQMVERLGARCQREFEMLLAARKVVCRLNGLERIVAEASSRREQAGGEEGATPPTPPHLLPPPRILAAHHASLLAPHQSVLNAKLQTCQAVNARLARVIRRQRADRLRLLARIHAANRDLVAANAALSPIVDHLAAEAREAASRTSA